MRSQLSSGRSISLRGLTTRNSRVSKKGNSGILVSRSRVMTNARLRSDYNSAALRGQRFTKTLGVFPTCSSHANEEARNCLLPNRAFCLTGDL